jgi:16S rRNA (guanine527-N7)-methyltransferase
MDVPRGTHPAPPEPRAPPPMTATTPLREIIERALDELRVPAPAPRQLDDLVAFAELLAVWGARMNLTAHRDPQAITENLVLDALAIGVHAPDFSSLADIGSGAGFPGIPVAILYGDRTVTLIESRERRHHFQRAAIRELGLGNVRALLGRAEVLEASPHSAAVAQAVAHDTSRPLMERWLAPDGFLLFPASPRQTAPAAGPGLRVLDPVHYRVPCGGAERVLWIAERGPRPA